MDKSSNVKESSANAGKDDVVAIAESMSFEG